MMAIHPSQPVWPTPSQTRPVTRALHPMLLRLHHLFIALTLVSGGLTVSPVRAGVIVNGDFETPGVPPNSFADWFTAFGSSPGNGGGLAQFRVGDDVGQFIQLGQFLNLHPRATSLSFEYELIQEMGSVGGGNFADSFTAALLGPSGSPVNPIDPFFLPAFFSVEPIGSSGFQEFTPSNGRVTTTPLAGGGRRVTLSLPPLDPGRYAISFQLRSDSDNRITTVNVDNVELTQRINPIPEPASVLVWTVVALMGAAHRRRSLRRS